MASAATSVMTRASLVGPPTRRRPSRRPSEPVGVVDHQPGDQPAVATMARRVVRPVGVLAGGVAVDPDEPFHSLVVGTAATSDSSTVPSTTA